MSNDLEKTKLLSPTLDVVFQHLFGEVGSEKITARFLEAILKEKIDNVDLSKNPILRRERTDDKLGVLDVVVQFNNKEYCDLEMQCYEKEDTIERILLYWSRLYSKQIHKSEKYSVLHRTICILISTKPVKGLEKLPYHTSWKIIEEKFRKTILTDKLELCIIDLSKIVNLHDTNNELLDWLFFLENPKCERVIEKMKKNEELKEAANKLEEMSSDEQMQTLAWWRQKAIWEENGAFDRRIRKTALNNGSEKKAKEIATKLLNEHTNIELICKVTGLSKEQIEQLK